MLNDKDVQGVYESYISALQKIKNVSHKVVPRQPDDHHEAETLEDRMQGDGGNGDPRNPSNTTGNVDSVEDNDNDAQPTNTVTQTPPTPIAILTLSTNNTDNEHNDMIKTDLYSIVSNAKKLYDLACQGHTFDPWMFSKISICSDSLGNITKVAEYDSVMNQ